MFPSDFSSNGYWPFDFKSGYYDDRMELDYFPNFPNPDDLSTLDDEQRFRLSDPNLRGMAQLKAEGLAGLAERIWQQKEFHILVDVWEGSSTYLGFYLDLIPDEVLAEIIALLVDPSRWGLLENLIHHLNLEQTHRLLHFVLQQKDLAFLSTVYKFIPEKFLWDYIPRLKEWLELHAITKEQIAFFFEEKLRPYIHSAISIPDFLREGAAYPLTARFLYGTKPKEEVLKEKAESFLSDTEAILEDFVPSAKLFAHIHAEFRIKATGLEGNNYTESINFMRNYLRLIQSRRGVFTHTVKFEQLLNDFSELAELSSGLEEIRPLKFLDDLNPLLDSLLRSVDCKGKVVVPGGWKNKEEAHALIYVLKRQDDDHYSLTVFNTGAGVHYHKNRVTNGKKRYSATVEVADIKKEFMRVVLKYLLAPQVVKADKIEQKFNALDIYGVLFNIPGSRICDLGHTGSWILEQRSGICSWKVLLAYVSSMMPARECKRFVHYLKIYSAAVYFQNYQRYRWTNTTAASYQLLEVSLKSLAKTASDNYARKVIDFEEYLESQAIRRDLQGVLVRLDFKLDRPRRSAIEVPPEKTPVPLKLTFMRPRHIENKHMSFIECGPSPHMFLQSPKSLIEAFCLLQKMAWAQYQKRRDIEANSLMAEAFQGMPHVACLLKLVDKMDSNELNELFKAIDDLTQVIVATGYHRSANGMIDCFLLNVVSAHILKTKMAKEVNAALLEKIGFLSRTFITVFMKLVPLTMNSLEEQRLSELVAFFAREAQLYCFIEVYQEKSFSQLIDDNILPTTTLSMDKNCGLLLMEAYNAEKSSYTLARYAADYLQQKLLPPMFYAFQAQTLRIFYNASEFFPIQACISEDEKKVFLKYIEKGMYIKTTLREYCLFLNSKDFAFDIYTHYAPFFKDREAQLTSLVTLRTLRVPATLNFFEEGSLVSFLQEHVQQLFLKLLFTPFNMDIDNYVIGEFDDLRSPVTYEFCEALSEDVHARFVVFLSRLSEIAKRNRSVNLLAYVAQIEFFVNPRIIRSKNLFPPFQTVKIEDLLEIMANQRVTDCRRALGFLLYFRGNSRTDEEVAKFMQRFLFIEARNQEEFSLQKKSHRFLERHAAFVDSFLKRSDSNELSQFLDEILRDHQIEIESLNDQPWQGAFPCFQKGPYCIDFHELEVKKNQASLRCLPHSHIDFLKAIKSLNFQDSADFISNPKGFYSSTQQVHIGLLSNSSYAVLISRDKMARLATERLKQTTTISLGEAQFIYCAETRGLEKMLRGSVPLQVYAVPRILAAPFFDCWQSLNGNEYVLLHHTKPIGIHVLIDSKGRCIVRDFLSGGQLVEETKEPVHVRFRLRSFDPDLLCWQVEGGIIVDLISYDLRLRFPEKGKRGTCDQFSKMFTEAGPQTLLPHHPGVLLLEDHETELLVLSQEAYTRTNQEVDPLNPFLALKDVTAISAKKYCIVTRFKSAYVSESLEGFEGSFEALVQLAYALVLVEDYKNALKYILKSHDYSGLVEDFSVFFKAFFELQHQVHSPDLYAVLAHILWMSCTRLKDFKTNESEISAYEGYTRVYHHISHRLRLRPRMEKELLDKFKMHKQLKNLAKSHAAVVEIVGLNAQINSFPAEQLLCKDLNIYPVTWSEEPFLPLENSCYVQQDVQAPIDIVKPLVTNYSNAFAIFFYQICIASYKKDREKLLDLFMQIGNISIRLESYTTRLFAQLLLPINDCLNDPTVALISEEQYTRLLNSNSFDVLNSLSQNFTHKYRKRHFTPSLAGFASSTTLNPSSVQTDPYIEVAYKPLSSEMSPSNAFLQALDYFERDEHITINQDSDEDRWQGASQEEKRSKKRKEPPLLDRTEFTQESAVHKAKRSRLRPRSILKEVKDHSLRISYEQSQLKKAFSYLEVSGQLARSSLQLIERLEQDFNYTPSHGTEFILPELNELRLTSTLEHDIANQKIQRLQNQIGECLIFHPGKIAFGSFPLKEALVDYFDTENGVRDRLVLEDVFVWFFAVDVKALTAKQAQLHVLVKLLFKQILISRAHASVIKLTEDLKKANESKTSLIQELQFVLSRLRRLGGSLFFDEFEQLKLFFEVIENKILRPKQLRVLELVKEHRSLAMQIPCGEGKTKLLTGMLALSDLRKGRLVLSIVPSSNFESNFLDLANQAEIFGIFRVKRLEFSRNDTTSFHDLYDMIQTAKSCGDILITTPQTVQSLLLTYLTCLDTLCSRSLFLLEAVEVKLNVFGNILNIFMNESTALIDEVHHVLDPLHLLNYSLASKLQLPSYRREVVEMLFQTIFALNQGRTDNFFPLGRYKDQEWNLDTYHSYQKGELAQALSQKLVEKMPEYLLGHERTIFDYLTFLVGTSDDEAAKFERWQAAFPADLAKLLKLLRAHLHYYLPHCLKMRVYVDFGPSDRSSKAVPYEHNMVPSDKTQFEHYDTLLNLTYAMYFATGLSREKLVFIVEHLQNVCKDESDFLHLLASGTTSAQAEEFHEKIKTLGIACADLSNSETVDALFASLRHDQLFIFYYLRNFVFQKMDVQTHKLSSNAQEIGASLFERVIAFSGTPSNYLTYPVTLPCMFDEGEDANMLGKLTHPEIVQIVEVDQVNLGELSRLGYAMFVDPHAYLEGISPESVSHQLLESAPEQVQYVLYFDLAQNVPMLLSRSGARIPFSQSKVLPEERITYYDQQHYSGVDIVQAEMARGCLLVNLGLTLTELIQASMRLRKLGLGQKLDLVVPLNVRRQINSLFNGEPLTLDQLIAWAVRNEGEALDVVQLPSLLHQVKNVFRRRLLKTLVASTSSYRGLSVADSAIYHLYTLHKELLIESVDYEDFIQQASLRFPKSPLQHFQDYFSEMVEKHGALLSFPEDQNELVAVQERAQKLLAEKGHFELPKDFKSNFEQEFELESQVVNQKVSSKKPSDFNPEYLGQTNFVKDFIESVSPEGTIALSDLGSRSLMSAMANKLSSARPLSSPLPGFYQLPSKPSGLYLQRLNTIFETRIFSPLIYATSNVEILNSHRFSRLDQPMRFSKYLADEIGYVLRITPCKRLLAERLVVLHDVDADRIRRWIVAKTKEGKSKKSTYQLFDLRARSLAALQKSNAVPPDKSLLLNHLVQVLFLNIETQYTGSSLIALKEWLKLDYTEKREFFFFQKMMRAKNSGETNFEASAIGKLLQGDTGPC